MFRIPAVVLCALVSGALLSLPPEAAALEGVVLRVSDGDTLTIMDDDLQQHRVRIAGIDAPERAQPFGRLAREALSDITRNQRVAVESSKTDRYRRLVGVVRVPPQDCADCPAVIDVGLSLVNAGLAWHYRAFEREQPQADRTRYRNAEQSARERRAGLWTEHAPVPPWEWRRRPVNRR
jgi:endonuclease YncB( thermonuclease family)